ncbi:MAG: hypothetical protein R3C52_15710, partial [Hyphomonadaceae bacterium]
MKTAFNNWWTVAGIIAASVTGFNLLRRFADIGLTTVLADLFDMYQHWIHFPVIKLFDLFSWPHPPSWAIDLVLLWILVAGVLTRTWLSMFGEISKYRDDYKVDFQTYLKIFLHTWLLMPVAVLGILHSPSVYRNDQT